MQQLDHQLPQPLVPRIRVDEHRLRARVAQHPLRDRVALRLVRVEQPVRRRARDHRAQLPAEVERVLEAQVEALPAGRQMDVTGVPGQQHPARPVPLGLPGGVRQPGQPPHVVHPQVAAGDLAQRGPYVLLGDRGAAIRVRPVEEGDRRPVHVGLQRERREPGPQVVPHHPVRAHRPHALAPRQLLAELRVRDHREHVRLLAREIDVEELAHRAAAAVAPHQIAAADLVRTVGAGDLDGDRLLVLRQRGQGVPAAQLGAQLQDAPGEQLLRADLGDEQHIRVPGVEVLELQRHAEAREVAALQRRGAVQEVLGLAAHFEDFHAARVHSEGLGEIDRLRQALHHKRAGAGQPQFRGEHQTGGPRPGHHHIHVVSHPCLFRVPKTSDRAEHAGSAA